MGYLQIISHQHYSLEKLKLALEHKPQLIEYLSVDEISFSYVSEEYVMLCGYLDSQPGARMSVLTAAGDLDQMLQHPQISYESYQMKFFYQAQDYYQHRPWEPTDLAYKIASLNHNAHLHRCMAIDHMSRWGLMDRNDCVISWHNLEPTYSFRWYPGGARILAGDQFKTSQGGIYHTPRAVMASGIWAVVESSHQYWFVTEKTTKPLVLGRLFLTLGCRGFMHRLRDLWGFELYDRDIDYAFDLCEDLEQRVDRYAQELSRLAQLSIQDFQEIYDKNLGKIQHNQHRAKTILQDPQFWPKQITEWQRYQHDDSVSLGDLNRRRTFYQEMQHTWRQSNNSDIWLV